ncbi:hypothetical protein C8R45DRAFT_928713 [Mycena sanguinolenta]|nr:hypothetical protein C8R45DRAFT_928713 [Mycena sanguinolenta]
MFKLFSLVLTLLTMGSILASGSTQSFTHSPPPSAPKATNASSSRGRATSASTSNVFLLTSYWLFLVLSRGNLEGKRKKESTNSDVQRSPVILRPYTVCVGLPKVVNTRDSDDRVWARTVHSRTSRVTAGVHANYEWIKN